MLKYNDIINGFTEHEDPMIWTTHLVKAPVTADSA